MDHLPYLLRAAAGTTPPGSINAAMLILGELARLGQSRSCGALWRSLLRTAVAVLEGLLQRYEALQPKKKTPTPT